MTISLEWVKHGGQAPYWQSSPGLYRIYAKGMGRLLVPAVSPQISELYRIYAKGMSRRFELHECDTPACVAQGLQHRVIERFPSCREAMLFADDREHWARVLDESYEWVKGDYMVTCRPATNHWTVSHRHTCPKLFSSGGAAQAYVDFCVRASKIGVTQ
ncbi:MAG: hypothetical protein GY938_29410 [Ketobacter sp.]|nr:hypothetical protein [Ketobacter sp.]